MYEHQFIHWTFTLLHFFSFLYSDNPIMSTLSCLTERTFQVWISRISSLDYEGGASSSLIENDNVISKMAVQFFTSTNSIWKTLLFYILTNIAILRFYFFSYLFSLLFVIQFYRLRHSPSTLPTCPSLSAPPTDFTNICPLNTNFIKHNFQLTTTLFQKGKFHSSIWISNVPSTIYTFSLSTHPFLDMSWFYGLAVFTWAAINVSA